MSTQKQSMRARSLLGLLLTLAACGRDQSLSIGNSALQARANQQRGTVPFRDPLTAAQPTNTVPAGTHLNYYGGRVLSNVKIVGVFWGPNVAAVVTGGIGGFYSNYSTSNYLDWLSEYNTVGLGPPTSNQTIGRGSFSGNFTIRPGHTSNQISDADLQSELDTQIKKGVAAGGLPTPDANTVYMVHFPPGLQVTGRYGTSCAGYCAAHSTFVSSQGYGEIFYGVLPDMSPSSPCYLGCAGADQFQKQTTACSHELTEAITDAEVGLTNPSDPPAPPLAWATPGVEIGDICAGQLAAFGDYTVQQEWSNSRGSCFAPHANDFSMSLSPASGTVSAGGSTSYTISTAVAAGVAQTVNLTVSISGLPSGISGSLSPTSVTAGGSSTLTISTASSAPAGTFTFTVTGTSISARQTATGTLTVLGKTPVYQGWLDLVDCTQAAGWGWDANQPNTPINLDIYSDGALQGTVAANGFRSDLLKAGIGNGYHAFGWPLPSALRNGQPHSIAVKFSGTTINLSGSPKSVTCSNIITASPNPVIIPVGQTTGTFTLTWSTPGYAQVDAYGDNSLSGQNNLFLGTAASPGSALEPISVGETATIRFFPHGNTTTLLGAVTVTGRQAIDTITASPNPVIFAAGQTTGTFTLSWDTPGYSQVDAYGDNTLTGQYNLFLGTAASPGSAPETLSAGETATIRFYPHGNTTTLLVLLDRIGHSREGPRGGESGSKT